LAQVLCQLPKFYDENLIVGTDTYDDAAVYKVCEGKAVILTMDFFTPVVDDPYIFGQIAAANALSDIYAMGGKPATAMNIACFPNCLSVDILAEIIKGGADKVKEAGAIIVGGHTIEDNEPKYGLSVMGFIHPDSVITNAGVKPGDVLVLTKPLGLGIISTAIKADLLDKKTIEKTAFVMSYLNKDACNAMLETGVNGCTDITGFGFLGHALEMARASSVTFEICSDRLPIIAESIELAKMGIIPAGAYKNKSYVGGAVKFNNNINQEIKDILFDPQTSGGLLIAVEKVKADRLLELLKNNKTEFSIIGKAKNKNDYFLEIV